MQSAITMASKKIQLYSMATPNGQKVASHTHPQSSSLTLSSSNPLLVLS
jgi:hypothetical protein